MVASDLVVALSMFEEMKHCEMDWKWKRKDRATREARGRACWKWKAGNERDDKM